MSNCRKKEGGLFLIKAKPNKISCSDEEFKVYGSKFKNDYKGLNEHARVIIDKIKIKDSAAIIHRVTYYNNEGFCDATQYFSKLVAAEQAANNYILNSKV